MKLLALLLLGCLLPTASWALTGSLHDDTFFVKVPSGEVEQVIIERVENGEVTNVESSLSRLEVLGNDMISKLLILHASPNSIYTIVYKHTNE